MVDFQAGLLHAAVQLDPKQGHAAQEVLVLHSDLAVQQTLKLQIREAQHADGGALADGVDALHHAAAEPDINIGRAVPEELVLQTAQAVQVNPNHAILTRAARAMVDRAQAMASAVLAFAMQMLMVMGTQAVAARRVAVRDPKALIAVIQTATPTRGRAVTSAHPVRAAVGMTTTVTVQKSNSGQAGTLVMVATTVQVEGPGGKEGRIYPCADKQNRGMFTLIAVGTSIILRAL